MCHALEEEFLVMYDPYNVDEHCDSSDFDETGPQREFSSVGKHMNKGMKQSINSHLSAIGYAYRRKFQNNTDCYYENDISYDVTNHHVQKIPMDSRPTRIRQKSFFKNFSRSSFCHPMNSAKMTETQPYKPERDLHKNHTLKMEKIRNRNKKNLCVHPVYNVEDKVTSHASSDYSQYLQDSDKYNTHSSTSAESLIYERYYESEELDEKHRFKRYLQNKIHAEYVKYIENKLRKDEIKSNLNKYHGLTSNSDSLSTFAEKKVLASSAFWNFLFDRVLRNSDRGKFSKKKYKHEKQLAKSTSDCACDSAMDLAMGYQSPNLQKLQEKQQQQIEKLKEKQESDKLDLIMREKQSKRKKEKCSKHCTCGVPTNTCQSMEMLSDIIQSTSSGQTAGRNPPQPITPTLNSKPSILKMPSEGISLHTPSTSKVSKKSTKNIQCAHNSISNLFLKQKIPRCPSQSQPCSPPRPPPCAQRPPICSPARPPPRKPTVCSPPRPPPCALIPPCLIPRPCQQDQGMQYVCEPKSKRSKHAQMTQVSQSILPKKEKRLFAKKRSNNTQYDCPTPSCSKLSCQESHDKIVAHLKKKYKGEILCIHNPPCILVNGCLNFAKPQKPKVNTTCYPVLENRRIRDLCEEVIGTHEDGQYSKKAPVVAQHCNTSERRRQQTTQSICIHKPPCEIVPTCYKVRCNQDPYNSRTCEENSQGNRDEIDQNDNYPKSLYNNGPNIVLSATRETASTQVSKPKLTCRHQPPCSLLPKCLGRVLCDAMLPYEAMPLCLHEPPCELIPACYKKAAKERVSPIDQGLTIKIPRVPCCYRKQFVSPRKDSRLKLFRRTKTSS